jgi:CO/xanthine dehydrogenase FAD-binding subunit
MRTALSGLEVIRPKSLEHALESMSDAAGERPAPLAGGTDLFVYLNAGTLSARRFLDLGALDALRGIEVANGVARIGALTTFREIREHPGIARNLPSLAAAAAEVGAWQIQNRATIAGNVANASPAGDSLPVLLAHDATVHARSVRGARDVAFADLYRGYRSLALEPDELIVAVSVPLPPLESVSFFRKVGTRRAQSISKVVFCGLLGFDTDGRVQSARLAFGSVAPVPLRALRAEKRLLGEPPSSEIAAVAVADLSEDIAPIDDIRSTRDYRLTVAGNVLAQFLRAAHPGYTVFSALV